MITLAPIMAVQVITKTQAATFTSPVDITDTVVKLTGKNWTTAQLTALKTATKGNITITSFDMSEINIISNNTPNLSGMFKGCTALVTVKMFTFPVAETRKVPLTETFDGCVNLERTIDLTAFTGLQSISNCFRDCKKLGEIRFGSILPPTSFTNAFLRINPAVKVFVAATGWEAIETANPKISFKK